LVLSVLYEKKVNLSIWEDALSMCNYDLYATVREKGGGRERERESTPARSTLNVPHSVSQHA